jgi:hypothetical protein
MKKLFFVGVIIAFLVSVAAMGAAAGATYSPFGNLKVGDCAYESMANLELHEFPWVHITTKDVVDAYFRGHENGYSAIPYMMTTGFGGQTILPIPSGTLEDQFGLSDAAMKAAIIQGVANGGVWSTVMDGLHAVAIIGADLHHVTIVDDGIVEHWSWGNFWWNQGPAGDNTMYAVTWNNVGT